MRNLKIIVASILAILVAIMVVQKVLVQTVERLGIVR
jgi:hypothetical protein